MSDIAGQMPPPADPALQAVRRMPGGKGRLILDHGVWQTSLFGMTPFPLPVDWGADPLSNRSWRFLLQQFAFADDLLEHDRVTGSDRGLAVLRQAVISWWDRHGGGIDPASDAWHDHATALRALRLAALRRQLAALAPPGMPDLAALLDRAIALHAAFLLDEAHYTRNTNHGFDQCIALYRLGADACRSEDDSATEPAWAREAVRLAAARLGAEIESAFAPDGGHRENSTGYHEFGMKQLVRLQALERETAGRGLPPIPGSAETLHKATRVLTHLLGPDGRLPLIGDTVDRSRVDIFPEAGRPAGYRHYRHALTRGRRGVPPPERSAVFAESGWISLRSGWGDPGAIHLVAKCGAASNYHRQDDDQTFVLKAHGEDWIVDGGLYQYAEKDPLRIHLRSHRAHCLTVPAGVKPVRNVRDLPGPSRIEAWDIGETEDIVLTRAGMFPGFLSLRSFRLDAVAGRVTIEDHVRPCDNDGLAAVRQARRALGYGYVSRFMFPPDKRIEIGEDPARIRILGRARVLRLECSRRPDTARLVCGVRDPEPAGWRSTTFGRIEPAPQLELFFDDPEVALRFVLVWEDPSDQP